MKLVYCKYLKIKSTVYVLAIFLDNINNTHTRIFLHGNVIHEWSCAISNENINDAVNFIPVGLFNVLIDEAIKLIEHELY